MGEYNEYRVARSTPDDTTFNTLELKRIPSFATLEFLDPGDSQFFASNLAGRGWRNVTPEPHKSRKTFEQTAPQPGELEAFLDIGPDWMYLSGHYGRTYYPAQNKTLTVLPAGFFNEPFHKAEWESAWTRRSDKGVFVQGESFDDSGATVFSDYVKAQQLIHKQSDFKSLDDRSASERTDEWRKVWQEPNVDTEVSNTDFSGSRGLLFGHVWDEVKVLILCCCNALVWSKKNFRDAFPNAVVLGWIGKNPVNAVPFIKQFLVNAFRDIKDPGDPLLMDPDHIATAWMDIQHKQGLYGAKTLGFMNPGGEVFGVELKGKTNRLLGTAEEITAHWVRKAQVFAFGVNKDATATEP